MTLMFRTVQAAEFRRSMVTKAIDKRMSMEQVQKLCDMQKQEQRWNMQWLIRAI